MNATQTAVQQRVEAIRHLADLGIPVTACGLHRLTADQLTRLAEEIQARVTLEGDRAFAAALGR